MPKSTIRLIVTSPMMGVFDKAIAIDVDKEESVNLQRALTELSFQLSAWMRKDEPREDAVEKAIRDIIIALNKSKTEKEN